MDGLIKGLADVAIEAIGRDRDDRDNESRDERSRSTWAEVVSGDNDEEVGSGDRRPSNENRRTNVQQSYGRKNEGQWNVEDSEPPRRTQMSADVYGQDKFEDDYRSNQYQGDQKGYGDDNNDGWETVGKKNQRQRHKVHKEQWNGYKRPPSEQEFSEDVDIGSSLEPSEQELADLSQACNKLWELDLNRLVPNKDYQIDCGEGKKVRQSGDKAEGTLFTWLSGDVFRKPTFARFCSLLDNYNPDVGHKEVVTSEEKQEQAAFIEEISRTAPIKYLHKHLSYNGKVSRSYQEFKDTLKSLWFDLYGRGGTSGSSSAFEHVFVGEIKQEGELEVTGFHNWLQFYLEEAKGRVDYRGYIFPRRRGEIPDSETQLLTIQFEWNWVLKSVSSTLIGVSPEFEVALYTLCFYMGRQDNYVELGPYPVNIKCYRLGDRIGSAFPVAES